MTVTHGGGSDMTRNCPSSDWKHHCRWPEGHHGPHACTGECDFTWPNENELTPCPSNAVAILGALEPNGARLRCGYLEGHQGPHRFVMEWTDNDPVIAGAACRALRTVAYDALDWIQCIGNNSDRSRCGCAGCHVYMALKVAVADSLSSDDSDQRLVTNERGESAGQTP